MRLTETRKKIIRAVAFNPFLATSDFYRLFGVDGQIAKGDKRDGQQRKIRYWLKRLSSKLLHHGREVFVLRKRWITPHADDEDERANNVYCYWLTPFGFRRALEKNVISRQEAGRVYASDSKSLLGAFHDQKVASFIETLRSSADQGGLDFAARFTDIIDEVHHIKPDHLFFLNGYYHFVEWENSKQGKYIQGESQLFRKFRHYLEYSASKGYRVKFEGMESFFVDIVVRNPERKLNLLRKMADGKFALTMFRVATEEECADLDAPVWASPNGRLTSLRNPTGRL